MKLVRLLSAGAAGLALILPAVAQDNDTDDSRRFTAERVFDIEYATSPQISPDGSKIVYVRHSMDRMKDQDRGDLWIIDVDSGEQRPLVTGGASASSPVWSPDGTRLLYTTSGNGKPELRLHYLDSGDSFSLAQFEQGPSGAKWSPDGKLIAFSMFVADDKPSFATPIEQPEGAEWNAPVRVFDDLTFRFDGAGYLEDGYDQVFVLSADGGSPRQITEADGGLSGPVWLDADTLLATGNLDENRDMQPVESEIYAVELSDKSVRALTSREGPDYSPAVSPDGKTIAFRGFDDHVKAYEEDNLYLMNADGSNVREIAANYEGAFGPLRWAENGRSLYSLVENAGILEIVDVSLNGNVSTVISNVGGESIGRPYADGSFSVSDTSRPIFAYTSASPDRPSDVAVAGRDVQDRVLTDLNGDVLPYLDMAKIEEIKVSSSADGREIEAWVALPPDFTADGSFPMILEIHGGPFSMYGPFFASEIQRYAAEGYVTVWANPRGSTGYGEEFAQLIDKKYPGNDHDDLMSVVDELVARDYVDPDRLFITGGSGGGILTAWAVTKTNRFAAAASVKPVINWMTMGLASDIGPYVNKHWIGANPWEEPEKFLALSPINYVGNVKTPTLMMVGEEDFRTPAWEAEQFYSGLKQNGVDTALIRVPGSPHYIASRPSRLIAKTDNIMGWFAKYDPAKQDDEKDDAE
ncbi:S9 family peptidase [Henriciella litoralis]|uniref:S9 family peptidase n=1 Tax=Henriciella litoralis TaxID=568102 RepID=UPI000A063969|nr:S9 family peptidase [Henriciella litoralis]